MTKLETPFHYSKLKVYLIPRFLFKVALVSIGTIEEKKIRLYVKSDSIK
jgi:hypothetical protein